MMMMFLTNASRWIHWCPLRPQSQCKPTPSLGKATFSLHCLTWACNSHVWLVSLQVNLATNQYLFTVLVNPSEMPCICLRHDVDGLVWQPRPKQPDNMLEHIATFNALGKTLDEKHVE